MRLEAIEQQIQALVRRTLEEDIGGGDLTAGLIPEDALAEARVLCRESAVLCGRAWFDAVFAELDPRIQIHWQAADGDAVQPGQTLCRLQGPARPLLSGERSALNLLQTLSGTATLARRYAERVADLPVRILDTRKTLPGLRHAQKYAVRTGGCHNHRLGLYDGILIKENHILAAGSIAAAVAAARRLGSDLPVEVEVEDLDEAREALDAGADILLLDNFDLSRLREAVRLNAGRAKLEASGGVTLDNLRAIAETGVDFISTGALTKDVRAIDLSMRFA
ncbi:carboxylating nicotinate-nucleotide diphosphorylase [Thiohalobacter sp. IOR34]|uniref:carboxylating nicotinate-nucleotide diphosphorylase n=1 Tax=Thiohalobacter sp. IOR34 TaxID=3057176 RepID=UPI0025B23F42|nr:carboxylating nicotinate-nucleotide diphosphorylase [Thiohalobacter sp. IOR34]WJW75079.1 carboxylating nicotinate-nucleotide diphosphorylase [Thiohalobacter sp. IOR34]